MRTWKEIRESYEGAYQCNCDRCKHDRERSGDESRYYGGNMWMAPNLAKGVICMLAGSPTKFAIISMPDQHGLNCWTDPDGSGRYEYTFEELKERLKDWTWMGTFRQYLNDFWE